MSRVSDLIDAYVAELALPWRSGLSGGERVWMLVYPPDLERGMRAALPRLGLATGEARHGWRQIDISDDLGRWLANHRYAEAFFEDSSDLTPSIVDQFEADLVSALRDSSQPPQRITSSRSSALALSSRSSGLQA